MECCPTHIQCLCEVAGYWWELEHAAVHVDPEHPKHVQMGDISGKYTGHGRTGTFSDSWNCLQILVTWGRILPC